MNSIQLINAHGATELHVRAFGLKGGNLRVDSCNECDPVDPSMWSKATRDEIHARIADGGHDKGRVLYVQAVQFPDSALLPAATLTLHVDDGLVRLLHLGHRSGAIEFQRRAAASILVACSREIARLHGCRRLELLTHRPSEQVAYRQFGFRLLPRRDRGYRGLRRNDFLLALRL